MRPNSLGEFATGERPPPLVVTFKQRVVSDSGAVTETIIDITGMTAKWLMRANDAAVTESAASITDGPGGKATYTWDDDDLSVAGLYTAEMWVGTAAGVKIASETLSWRVRPALKAITWA